MNPKKPPVRGPRAARPAQQPSKHYWHDRDYCCPWWYDCDYDYYDYDYDYRDWDFYSSPKRMAAPRPVKNMSPGDADALMVAYQQGFKDGWAAAMEYMVYGEPQAVEPTPGPTPAPMKPVKPGGEESTE